MSVSCSYALSELVSQCPAVKLVLEVQYTDGYPDTLPDLSVEAVTGSLEKAEIESLLQELREVVCRSLDSHVYKRS